MKKSKTLQAIEWVQANPARTDAEAAHHFKLASPAPISQYRKKYGIDRHGTCITHHHACECREQKIAALIKAAQDCAVELDELKKANENYLDKIAALISIVKRVYVACDMLEIK
jgi:hypothetical protein